MMDINNWEYDEQKTRPGDPLIADKYHFTQIKTIWALGFSEVKTVHDCFVRRTPFGSYLLVNGIERVIKHLHNFRFTAEDIEAISLMDPLSLTPKYDGYLDYLANLRFKGDVWAIPEGNLAFPKEPILRVEGNWAETWMVESAILKAVDDASLIATYASRVKEAAGRVPSFDFGLRRSKGDGANVSSARAAYVGGLDATSNGRAASNLKIPWVGTTSHEGIAGLTALLGSEVDAFVAMMTHNEGNDVLIADTFSTMSGTENIKRAAKIVGRPVKGVRTDSGDKIGYAFKMRESDPNKEGFEGIMPTGDYTFELIHEAIKRGAPVTGFAVGGKMVAPSNPTTAGSVYKLVAMNIDEEMVPVIKISDDEIKTLLPDRKNTWRKVDGGQIIGDVIASDNEGKPDGEYEPVLVQVMRGGNTRRSKILIEPRDLQDIQAFARENIAMLPTKYRRIENPVPYPVRISDNLKDLQRKIISEIKAKQAQIDEIVIIQ